jgi:HEPN domain-containing protein
MSVQEQAEVWLRRARSNLAIAHKARSKEVLWEDLCFEAQQAAEKSLKALLIFYSGEYPRKHSLSLLLEKLQIFVAVPEEIKEVVELSDYAVQARYPGDYYPVSQDEYDRAVELAQRVLSWAEEQVYRSS